MRIMSIPWLALSAVLFGTVVGTAMAQNPMTSPGDLELRLQNLKGMSDGQLTDLYTSLNARNESEVSVLSQQLNSQDIQVQYRAACLLGVSRSPSAVPALANALKLEDTGRNKASHGRLWLWTRYPAAEALIQIGKPAEPWMIDDLAASVDPKIRYLSLLVITAIERDDAVTQSVLKQALNRETDAARKTRLQAVVSGLASERSNLGYLNSLLPNQAGH